MPEDLAGLSLRERRMRRTQEAIEVAALGLFADQGYQATTVDQIAAAAEVGRRTFFRYFADKEEVLFGSDPALLAVLIESLTSGLADLDRTPTPADARRLVDQAALRLAEVLGGDRQRLQRRETVIASSASLTARSLLKQHRYAERLTELLVEAGVDTLSARLATGTAVAVLLAAYQQWLTDAPSSTTLPAAVLATQQQALGLTR